MITGEQNGPATVCWRFLLVAVQTARTRRDLDFYGCFDLTFPSVSQMAEPSSAVANHPGAPKLGSFESGIGLIRADLSGQHRGRCRSTAARDNGWLTAPRAGGHGGGLATPTTASAPPSTGTGWAMAPQPASLADDSTEFATSPHRITPLGEEYRRQSPIEFRPATTLQFRTVDLWKPTAWSSCKEPAVNIDGGARNGLRHHARRAASPGQRLSWALGLRRTPLGVEFRTLSLSRCALGSNGWRRNAGWRLRFCMTNRAFR